MPHSALCFTFREWHMLLDQHYLLLLHFYYYYHDLHWVFGR